MHPPCTKTCYVCNDIYISLTMRYRIRLSHAKQVILSSMPTSGAGLFLPVVLPQLEEVEHVSMPWLQVHRERTLSATAACTPCIMHATLQSENLQLICDGLSKKYRGVSASARTVSSARVKCYVYFTLIDVSGSVVEHTQHWHKPVRVTVGTCNRICDPTTPN